MPVFIFIVVFIITYVACFKDEFDQENIKSVWIVVGAVALIVVVGAVFKSFGSASANYF